MDNRRTTRASENPTGISTRRTASRSSPARKSPTRKSPARRSPARTTRAASKTKTSPKINKAPSVAGDEGKPRGRPRKQATASNAIPESEVEEEDNLAPNMSPMVVLPTLSAENIRTLTSHSANTSKTTTTTTTSRVKVTGDDGEEINELTEKYVQEARAKLDQMGPRLRFTPTPSEVSRLSVPPSRSVSRSIAGDYDEYSDNDDDDEQPLYESFTTAEKPFNLNEKSYFPYASDARKDTNQEFYGNVGAFLLMLVASVGGIYLQYTCTRKSCDLVLPQTLPTFGEFKEFVVPAVMYIYVGLCTAVLVLFVFPLSRASQITDQFGIVIYRFNGIAIGVLTLIAVACSEKYLQYPTMKTIYRNYLPFTMIAVEFALLLSVVCYIRSKYQNPQTYNRFASSGRFLSDFYIGRHTSWLAFDRFDLKFSFYRVSAIVALVINSIFFYKTLKFAPLPVIEANATQLTYPEIGAFAYAHVKYEPMPLLIASMVLVYVVDMLWQEEHMVRSFEMQQEGIGAHLLLRYALFPFHLSMMPKYAFEHILTAVPSWAAWMMAIVYLVGLFIKRRSCNIKYAYRTNPSNPKFATLETLPTFQGRRLIVGSYWGIVRHPNYLGEIICAVAICIPLIWHFAWPPLIVSIATIALLVHRAHRIHGRQSARYNSAWTRYCQHVPYKLIPRVY